MSEKSSASRTSIPELLNLYGDGGNILVLRKRLEWRRHRVRGARGARGRLPELWRRSSCSLAEGPTASSASCASTCWPSGPSSPPTWRMAACWGPCAAATSCWAIRTSWETRRSRACRWSISIPTVVRLASLATSQSRAASRRNPSWATRTMAAARTWAVAWSRWVAWCTVMATMARAASRAAYKNVVGTYIHGPLLPKNPGVADYLTGQALERRYGSSELAPLDDEAELAGKRCHVPAPHFRRGEGVARRLWRAARRGAVCLSPLFVREVVVPCKRSRCRLQQTTDSCSRTICRLQQSAVSCSREFCRLQQTTDSCKAGSLSFAAKCRLVEGSRPL